MPKVSRRNLITGAAAVAAGAVAVPTLPPPTAVAQPLADTGTAVCDPAAAAVVVRPADARYAELSTGVNKRWTASPESIRLVGSTDHVVRVVQEAVRAGKRVSVRSGGHCYADFVSNADIDIIIDTAGLKQISYDAERRAFCVGAGAQLGQIYEALYKGWGTTIPGGACLTVGIGGHASGGGFGLLTRKYGLVADHIEAVEMVVVDSAGTARSVIVSRGSTGAAADLWWATTGGGGGSFGVITRYWFRSAGATGTDPARQLPAPPKDVLVALTNVPWSAVDRPALTRLVTNFGDWHVRNGSVDSPFVSLSGYLLMRQGTGPGAGVGLFTQVDGTDPRAEQLLADYGAAVTRDTGISPSFPFRRVGWLASTKLVGTASPPLLYDHTLRSSVKTAYLRKSFTEDQIGAIHRNMTRTDYANVNAAISLNGGGGQHNAVPPAATASSHRATAFFALYESFWTEQSEDPLHLGWQRDIYGETFANTGGYPVPNDLTDGCYINNPDPDIMDPAYNKSQVPWHTLYFKDNYARLQRAKAQWDPTDFFRHSQSIRLPGQP
ncbi:FAD-binding protein [Streptomyces sp. NPDC093544]|uniref:FAD-dependent oxidoreductase n=1 Tax=Streptomyces sp. NPDC093544 TaxID=3155200 RepID=UPI003425580C